MSHPQPEKVLPQLPPDYDTKEYVRGDIVPARLIPLNKHSKHSQHKIALGLTMGDPIPPSMLDGVHYRWDGEDFIAVPPPTGGPWHVSTVVPAGFPVFFNDA